MNQARRRKLIRLLGWLIGGFASFLAVLVVLVAIYLSFFDYPEKLRVALEDELSEISGAPATIRSISLDLPRYAFELRGMTLRTPDRDRPVLEVDRLRGKLRLSEVLNLRLQWNELLVDGLVLHLVEDQKSGIRLPIGRSEPTPLAGLTLGADRISVANASIVIENERVPWELQAENLGLTIVRLARNRYQGELRYEQGGLRIQEHEEIRASLDAAFEVIEGELRVRRAEARSGLGQLSLSGSLRFSDPVRGRFEVEAEGDVASSAEAVFGLKGASSLAGGEATFRGLLVIEPAKKTLQGTVVLPRGSVAGVPLADWKGEVYWDRSLLQVSYAQGLLAGGGARLQIHQPLPASEHAGEIEVDVRGALLSRILERETRVPSPIESSLSGSGSFSLGSEPERELGGTLELEGAPPTGTAEGRVPLTFRARLRLTSGDLEIEDATFETPFLEATLSGLYPGEGTAHLGFELEAKDLGATDRLRRDLARMAISSEAEPAPLWGIDGRGRAQGELTGRLPRLVFEGDLAAESFRLHSIQLGSFQSRASLSDRDVRFADLTARFEGGVLEGRGATSLVGPLPERDFDLDLTLSNWPLSELLRGLEPRFEAEGRVSGGLTARRAGGWSEGSAAFELERLNLAGEDFDGGEAELALTGTRIRLEPISLIRGSASIGGAVELDTVSRKIQGSLSTRGFPLQRAGPEGETLGGVLDAEVSLSGRIEEPELALSGRGRGIRFHGLELGEASFAGALKERSIELKASLERGTSQLEVETKVRLEAEAPAEGELRWRGVDLLAFSLLDSSVLPVEARAISDGNARFRVPLRASAPVAKAELEGRLERLVLQGSDHEVESRVPIEFRLAGGRLELDRIELGEKDTRLVLGGTVDLKDGTLDWRAEGLLSLAALESFYPNLAASGETSISARVGGSWDRPSLTGYADLKEGSLRFEGFRQALGGLRGKVVFDNRTMRIEELEGVFGSGPVVISGTLALEGLGPGSVDLRIRGSGIRLRYPEGLGATLEGDLSLVGSPGERMLSGTVVLNDAVWRREYDLASGILADREGLSLFDDLPESELLGDLRLDVRVRAPSSLKVRNSLAVIDASAELELRGTVAEPVLLGQSEAEYGEVYFLGQRYTITSGKVDFVDPAKVEPFIDLTAETRVRNYRVELRLTGTPERFFPELTSDPPLRTVDILRLLAGATERELTESLVGNEEEELAGVGVASLLTERLSQEMGRRAERLFGLDRFSVNPFLVGQFANPTARVSLGKQITRELSINYSTNLNATTEAIILIEYTPQGPMSWVLSRDEEGDVGIDVKFRKSF